MDLTTVDGRAAYLRDSSDLDGFLHHCEHARELAPRDRDTVVQYAAALGFLNRAVEKLSVLDEWLVEHPHDMLANVHRGVELLRQGRYAEGWKGYHYRKALAGNTAPDLQVDPQRQWLDQALAGKTVVLLHEQGLGDSIQFARLGRILQDRHGADVRLNVQEALRNTFAASPALPSTVQSKETIQIHYWKLLGDLLPMAFPTVGDVTWPGSYIAPPAMAVPCRFPDATKLRVGLAWRGNPNHDHDAFRSAKLRDLAQLQEATQCRFYALTPDAGTEIRDAGDWLTDLSDQTTPFDRLAQMIGHLDVIVSVCTSVAHLAAAMGKPTILMLSTIADWRWGRAGTTTPWYPSVTLMRQLRLGDWSDLAARVATHLQRL